MQKTSSWFKISQDNKRIIPSRCVNGVYFGLPPIFLLVFIKVEPNFVNKIFIMLFSDVKIKVLVTPGKNQNIKS